MKTLQAIVLLAAIGVSSIGISAIAEGKAMISHPRWTEYKASRPAYDAAVAYAQKTGDLSQFCQVTNEREAILIDIEATPDMYVSEGDLELQKLAIQDLDMCVEEGYLTSHVRQTPTQKSNDIETSNQNGNDIGGFMDALNEGLGLNIDLNRQRTLDDFKEECVTIKVGYLRRTFERRGYGGTDTNFYECWKNGGIVDQFAP